MIRAFFVGAAVGSGIVGVFLALFSAKADEWESAQVAAYHVNFPGTQLPPPSYLPQRTFGGVTSHVVVDWSDAPAT